MASVPPEREYEERWVIVCDRMLGGYVYAERNTRAEIEQVLEEQRSLILRFGQPRIEQRVVPLR